MGTDGIGLYKSFNFFQSVCHSKRTLLVKEKNQLSLHMNQETQRIQSAKPKSHILVIGANGGIGRQCVEAGLAAGNQVTALLRSPANLTLTHPNLIVVAGDVTQPGTLAKHLPQKDAVISAIGSGGIGHDKPTTLYSEGAATLLAELAKTNTRRVFFISSIAMEIDPSSSLFIRFMAKYVMHPLLKHMFADIRRMEAVIKPSNADWTIIRPPQLTNGRQTGHYRYAINQFLPKGTQISRADLALFIIQHLNDRATFKAVVEVAY